MKISVTSNAFSKNEILLRKLEKEFPEAEIQTTTKRYSRSELIKSLSNSNAAIVGLDIIDREVLENCSKLEVISKYGVGTNNLDLEGCKEYGVKVLCESGVNKKSVAELTLGMILNLSRNIQLTSNQLKAGKWNKSGGYDLSEKAVGIVGVGNVGKELVRFLNPFNCRILGNDIIDQSIYYKKNNIEEVELEYLFANSDIVTIHVPLTEKTKDMVNKKVLSLMKSTSYFINTSRGEVVNQEDLYQALIEEKIAGAALDVYSIEPPHEDFYPTYGRLLSLENVICTPHIAGNSKEAVLNMGYAAIKGLKNYFVSKK
jgi:D-3-phosphoglycerate dehydrogenase